MVKVARVVGGMLLLAVMLAACDPLGAFYNSTTYYSPTPTPRLLEAADVADVVSLQLTQAGLPVTSVEGAENSLVVVHEAGSAAEAEEIVLAVSRAIGGYAELGYINLESVVFQPAAGGAEIILGTEFIDAWYNRELDDEAFLALLVQG